LALNKVISKNIFELDALNLEIKSFFDKKEKEYHEMSLAKMFSGIENRVILGMTLISGFPVVMLVKEVMSLLKVSNKEIIVLVECAFYLAYVVYYFYNTIMIIRESANHKTWIVNFE
nr:hypothetical protein [Klebsiella variicola]